MYWYSTLFYINNKNNHYIPNIIIVVINRIFKLWPFPLYLLFAVFSLKPLIQEIEVGDGSWWKISKSCWERVTYGKGITKTLHISAISSISSFSQLVIFFNIVEHYQVAPYRTIFNNAEFTYINNIETRSTRNMNLICSTNMTDLSWLRKIKNFHSIKASNIRCA